ncbi:MAG: capsule biosynthesis protein [Rhodobacteraceae bacterium]|nr:capsule biosynthesis protein [Paracoccaceae bacterium]
MTNSNPPDSNPLVNKTRPNSPEPGTPAYKRMARRKAVRMGLNPTSGEDAVRMLQERGFDITNDRVSMLDATGAAQEGTTPNLPAKVKPVAVTESGGKKPPSGMISEAERMADIKKIQRSIARRRQRKFLLVTLRLLFFVGIPTYLCGNYYFNYATEMYEVQTEMVIQKADGGGGGGGLGGLLAGTGLANSEDSTIVQGFLTSREAMLKLDAELGFIAHFQQDFIDDIQRLPEDSTLEDAYVKYKKYINIGFDPSEGVIHMSVISIDPATGTAFSLALIRFAEERVDRLSAPVREDQMRGAFTSYAKAEQGVLDAQQSVLELQQTRGVLSADAEISAQMSIIGNLESLLENKRLNLAEINANAQPNSARANALSAEIGRLADRITELRGNLIGTNNATVSLARISGELRIAESELTMRQVLLQQALTQLETAQIEANRQTRYLSLGVSPIAPDVPTHPRKLENTALAFIVFLGLYIFVSLTISILREQLSA